MFDRYIKEFWRSVRGAIWNVLRAGFMGVVIGALVGEVAGFFLLSGWPNQPFVHVAAAAFALTLGYAVMATTALIEGVRGLATALSNVDDVAKAAVSGGINVIDTAVDMVDGPNRHGIR